MVWYSAAFVLEFGMAHFIGRVLVALTITAATTQAQSGPLWSSYTRASGVLAAAAEAHGGAQKLRGLQQIAFHWEGFNYAPTQGRLPAWDTTGNKRGASQQIAIDYAKNRMVTRIDFLFFGGYRNSARIISNGKEFLQYDPTAGFNGTSFSRDTGGLVAPRQIARFAAFMPVLLIKQALERATTLRYVGETTIEGRPHGAISFTDAEGNITTLVFDATTHRLVRRDLLGSGSLGDEIDSWTFSEYETIDGLLVPRRMDSDWNGRLAERFTLKDFAVGRPVADSLLAIPAGYTQLVPAGQPEIVKVGEGVWFVERIGGGYRSLVVETDEGILVTDAPLNPGATRAAIALVEKTFPGKKVSWVAITHHHGDHMGGLPAYATTGATILAGSGSEDYLRTMASVPRTLGQIPLPTQAPPPVNVVGVKGRRVFGKGAVKAVVIDIGPTSHAASMLAVYVPTQKLLFQGDLLRINDPGGVATAVDAANDLDRIIRTLKLDVQTIGSVHGKNGTLADVKAAQAKPKS